MPCLIELNRDKDAEKLFKQFEEDGTAIWMYSRALLDFRKYGDSQAADKSLKAALDENQYVPSYFLGRKKMPRAFPGHYGFGDDNEAVLYAHGNGAALKATPRAMEWLAAKSAPTTAPSNAATGTTRGSAEAYWMSRTRWSATDSLRCLPCTASFLSALRCPAPLESRGSPSLARPFGGAAIHRITAYFRLTAEASAGRRLRVSPARTCPAKAESEGG